MWFVNYLKAFAGSVADSYNKAYRKTYTDAFVLSIICLAGAAVLLHYTEFAPDYSSRVTGMTGYFFRPQSRNHVFSLIDLSKTVFVFFLAFFSLGFSALLQQENNSKSGVFSGGKSAFTPGNILLLIITLVLACGIEYLLESLKEYLLVHAGSLNTFAYQSGLIFQLKIYIPLLLFALTLHLIRFKNFRTVRFKQIFWLFLSCWLVNEFFYESLVFIRDQLFALILLPVERPDRSFMAETIASIPVLACYFIAFHAAFTFPLGYKAENKPEIAVSAEEQNSTES